MKYIIWGGFGVVIAVFAAVFLIRLLILKKKGIITDAEVIAVREDKKNTYIHTLRFSDGENVYEKDDKTGFSQPFTVGEIKTIVYDPDKPENFEFADELKKNIIIVLALIGIALAFAVRWLFLGLNGS